MKQKNELTLYLVLTFGLAWLLQVVACVSLWQGNAALFQPVLAVSMFCPLVAVLAVTRLLGHRPTGVRWRPQFRGRLGFWLAAWMGPMVLTLLGGALYYAIFPARLDLDGSYLLAAMGGEWTLDALKTELGITPVSYLIIGIVQAVSYAPPINMLFAVGEEAGWRGFMMPCLKERFGLWKGRLLGAAIWAAWHWPVILLAGYEYGTNYLGAPLSGLVVWFVVCFALGSLLDWLYDAAGSIWAPALAHGAFNAAAALPVLVSRPEDAYYSVLGPMPVGLIAILPTLALAIWLTVRQAKQEK